MGEFFCLFVTPSSINNDIITNTECVIIFRRHRPFLREHDTSSYVHNTFSLGRFMAFFSFECVLEIYVCPNHSPNRWKHVTIVINVNAPFFSTAGEMQTMSELNNNKKWPWIQIYLSHIQPLIAANSILCAQQTKNKYQFFTHCKLNWMWLWIAHTSNSHECNQRSFHFECAVSINIWSSVVESKRFFFPPENVGGKTSIKCK